jgi:hypothetical protein
VHYIWTGVEAHDRLFRYLSRHYLYLNVFAGGLFTMSFLKQLAQAAQKKLVENVPEAAILERAVQRLPEGIQRTHDEIVGEENVQIPARRDRFPDMSSQVFLIPTVRFLRRQPALFLYLFPPLLDRHETRQEKMDDAIRAKINASHRFQSFATERTENFVKW